ncbi:MAG: proteasome assembly chaperone family protein [Candidatus Limnocylindrales bacterium]
MSLYRIEDALPSLDGPIVIAAMDGWVDAGSAATSALAVLADGATPIATFDADALFDYRSRRPTLEIRDGRPSSLAWPALVLRFVRVGERDILILSGAEPDDRWHTLADAVVELMERLDVRGWISLGAIPAAVPHTRPVPILGTESSPGLLRGGVQAGPAGLLKVPAAALSMLEMAAAAGGIPAVGYFAQIPHYVTGPYATAAVALLRALERHLDVELPRGDLSDEARALRVRLDAAAAADESTHAYVGRLEVMVDESRQPEGDDLITEIERFLRDRSGGEG